MARYIDADEALRMMRNSKEDKPSRGDWDIAHDCCIDCVNGAPTADVVEVKRGEWIKKFKYSHGYDDYYNTECSLCGYKAEKSGVGDKLSLDNFCPNCGADMRGENDG